MAKLIYSSIGSLDGYVADEHGKFGWAAPDEEVHAFVNDLERPVGTYLDGRRMYEVMVIRPQRRSRRLSIRRVGQIVPLYPSRSARPFSRPSRGVA